MDLEKHKLIDKFVLSCAIKSKEQKDDWCGVYVYGDDRNFVTAEHIPAIHSFRTFSLYNYPIYLFLNTYRFGDVEKLLHCYNNIFVIPILPLRNSFEYNYWFVNSLWHLVPGKHRYCITFQNDGYLLRSGFEEFVEKNDLDYIGAVWKSEVKLKTKLNFPGNRVGNGGFSARKPKKMLEVIEFIHKHGGQEKLVQGQYNDNKLSINHHLCPEDAIFTHFGFGAGLFKRVSIEQASVFAHEPIEFALAVSDLTSKPYGFHRCDF